MAKKIFIGILTVILLAAGAGVYLLLFTAKGGEMVVRQGLNVYTGSGSLDFGQSQGSLVQGITFEHLELKDLKALPEGSLLRIQRLFVNLTSFDFKDLVVEAENIRLLMPNSEPIVLAGTYKGQILDFNLYSASFPVHDLLHYLPADRLLKQLSGSLKGVDLFVKGAYDKPVVTGAFLIERLNYDKAVFIGIPCTFHLEASGIKRDVALNGNVSIAGGTVKTDKVTVFLESGRISFNGSMDNPSFYIKGNSLVERTKIFIALKGSYQKPEIELTSDPPLAREQLMVMLVTGKRWEGAEKSLDEGRISPELTKEFIDYFLFAGKGGEFAEKFGLRDFSVTYEKDKKGLSVAKSLSDNIVVEYDVQQKGQEAAKIIDQKLLSEVKVTESLSVEMEKEIKGRNALEPINDPKAPEGESKIFLKYKKGF